MPSPSYLKHTIHNQLRRAVWHNYYGKAVYMVTISKNGSCPPFGTLIYTNPNDAYIQLSSCGEIIKKQIEITPAYHPQLKILSYVIMPDHVHLLLWLGEPLADGIDIPGNDGRRSFLEGGDGPARGPGPTALPKIINAVKSLTTRRLGEPIWQDHYYDHIIRNQRELENTRQYIRDNPVKWFLNRESDHSVF